MKFFAIRSQFEALWDATHVESRGEGPESEMLAYKQLFDDMGELLLVDSAAEARARIEQCIGQGDNCVYLACCLPHEFTLDIPCPVVSVFGWRYNSIPQECWAGNAANDWRVALGTTAGAITFSSFSRQVVAAAMAETYAVAAMPVPVWDKYVTLASGESPRSPFRHGQVHCDQLIMDSRQIDFTGPQSEALRKVLAGGGGSVDLEGLVYTLCVDPMSATENMHDALWAFCWAFRDMPEITLVIALKQADLLAATDRVLTALYTLEPFQCRVVMLGGLLAAGEYRQLIQATSFVLSSACAQAQGLSMMQFMSAGVPVIAPRHTAAADYLDDRCALVVKSSPEWVEWPHDPRIVRRAFRQRINWQSMLEAVQQSHRLAIEDGDAYAAMSQSAIENQRQFCSYAVVSASLAAFFAAEGFSRARSPGGHGALQPAIVRSGGLWLKLKHGIKKRLGLVN